MKGKHRRMGGKLTCHLNSKEHRYISDHIAAIMENLAPLYRRQYSSSLLMHMRNKHVEPTEPRPLIQHPDVVAHAGILLEGTLPQYLEGIWTHRHLQVTSSFIVESRDAKEVFEGGWGCKTELVLSGCQICTSTREHCELVDDMCRHITGKSGEKLACWDCPTAFPVFIQHPYSAPVCLATASQQEQTRWANILRAATQHQSSALWCENSPESKAFLDAVSSLKKFRENCQTEVHPMGNEEEVLVSMLMEEVMSYLKNKVFPRFIGHHSRRKQAWMRLLSEVYKTAKQQVRAAMSALKEELSLHRADVEKQISAGLQQASLLHDHIAHTITDDMCEPMLQSLLHTIIPRLGRTLQEVATPICDGFAATWQYFLETCDDIIDLGSMSISVKDVRKEVLTPLSGLGPDDDRMWQCLDGLELSSEGRAWLQETWGVHSGTWRPLVVDMCVVMFLRLVSRYPCFSLDSAQLTAVLCRVKDKVVKHLDTELLALRSQLILETILQITLPAYVHSVGEQDLSRYEVMLNSEQALFIHPDIIFHSILRDSLTSYIQSVMRYSLPQQFVPLPVSPITPCGSSSGFSEPVYELLPPGDCFQASAGSSSGSETLTPSSMSDQDDTLTNSENSENHTLSLLDAGEYVRLTEP
ncbi:protein Niban 1-like isoform X2 [Toxotes jaculatrix]|uniref:protein Niban 1-like isoform X2 n=1 Tax=Toxotes jaculatrix TaxID=941984 RepID=UPI001B3ADDFB|nr:protein Niban 1-like isoform X2 [Toxotes jaculatrix]